MTLNKDKIIEFLKDKDASKRRNIYTSLYVYTNDADYQRLMTDDIKTYQNQMKERKKSDKQETNWITRKDIYKRPIC